MVALPASLLPLLLLELTSYLAAQCFASPFASLSSLHAIIIMLMEMVVMVVVVHQFTILAVILMMQKKKFISQEQQPQCTSLIH